MEHRRLTTVSRSNPNIAEAVSQKRTHAVQKGSSSRRSRPLVIRDGFRSDDLLWRNARSRCARGRSDERWPWQFDDDLICGYNT